VRCPFCGEDDEKVIDSRPGEDGAAIRRRRELPEVPEALHHLRASRENRPLFVVKRDGGRQPFDRQKMMAGMLAAVKGRSVDETQIEEMAERLEDSFRSRGTEVSSNEVGLAVLDELRVVDEVAYMRFASVYKNFDDAADFRRELALLEKHANSERAQRT